jgi:hypothetical protein
MLSKEKVYFDKWYDAGGLFRENKEKWLKLRLAGRPKFLLKAIYEDELKKSYNVLNPDVLTKELAWWIAEKKFEEMLYYLDKVDWHSPFVLYYNN